MTTRTFAQWVVPSAEQLRQSRTEIARTARQLLPEHWSMPSPLEGWSYKDLLAHLATGDRVFQTVLRAVTAGEPLDIAKINLDYVNAGNGRLLEERKERPVEELIVEVEAEGEKTQELLAKLSDADEGRTQEGAPMSLAEGVRSFPGHDRDHLAQLKTVLDNVML
jgi:uncharacterized protein (TIGR03083 family)